MNYISGQVKIFGEYFKHISELSQVIETIINKTNNKNIIMYAPSYVL